MSGIGTLRIKMTPLVLVKEYGHSNWKFNLIIWEAFTSLEKGKQGLAVFLFLISQDKQAVRTISVENLHLDNGVKLITEMLDKLYLKDESSL